MGLFKNHKFDTVADSSLKKQLHILHATPDRHIIDWITNNIKKQEDELNGRLYQIKKLDEKNSNTVIKNVLKKFHTLQIQLELETPLE